MDEEQELRSRNKHLNTLLQNAVEALEDERKAHALSKNKVPGGYYMMNRRAEKNLRDLQRENSTASLVFSVLREQMQIGTNAVTISNHVLAKILNKSPRTIARATTYLATNNYVQIIKVGNTNTYVVNEQIAFSGRPGQRKAVFSSTIVAHESEQEEGWNEVKKLKAIPALSIEEEVA